MEDSQSTQEMETEVPDAVLIAAHGCENLLEPDPNESETANIPTQGNTASWSNLDLQEQIHWRRSRCLSNDEYKSHARKWYHKPELQAMKGTQPTKALLLEALHYFGISQLLGIDEKDSQNIITPFQTNNHFKGKQWYVHLSGLKTMDLTEAILSAEGRDVDMQER